MATITKESGSTYEATLGEWTAIRTKQHISPTKYHYGKDHLVVTAESLVTPIVRTLSRQYPLDERVGEHLEGHTNYDKHKEVALHLLHRLLVLPQRNGRDRDIVLVGGKCDDGYIFVQIEKKKLSGGYVIKTI